jgi:D-arabinose 1-dehydrogenase-like Zn-dependent alcohol dehydrogenase
VLAPDGRFLPVVMTMREVRQLMTTRLFRGPRVLSGMATGRKTELQELVNLAAAGTLRPVIGRTFSFDDIAAAHRYVDAGRKVGSAVVLVDQQGHR